MFVLYKIWDPSRLYSASHLQPCHNPDEDNRMDEQMKEKNNIQTH